MVSQKCLPYLRKSKNPHIINISPPLNMVEKWFAPHVAYTMAKFGMSMCVLGKRICRVVIPPLSCLLPGRVTGCNP